MGPLGPKPWPSKERNCQTVSSKFEPISSIHVLTCITLSWNEIFQKFKSLTISAVFALALGTRSRSRILGLSYKEGTQSKDLCNIYAQRVKNVLELAKLVPWTKSLCRALCRSILFGSNQELITSIYHFWFRQKFEIFRIMYFTLETCFGYQNRLNFNQDHHFTNTNPN